MAALSDVGGRSEYFGTIDREVDEPVFHDSWEGRVFGMAVYVQSLFGPNTDAARSQMEQLPTEVFWSSYYRRWLGGLERRLVHDGYLGADEVEAHVDRRDPAVVGRRAPRGRRAVASAVLRRMARPTLPTWFAAHVLPRALGNARPTLRRPRYSVGDAVRVGVEPAPGHTRRPDYVSGKTGVITARHGAALLPDAHAEGRRDAQHLYTVAFAGTDLWGDAAEPGTELRIDLFEPYLETP